MGRGGGCSGWARVTAAAIGGWAQAQPEKAARLKALRGALAAAKATVGAAVPRLQRAVDTVVKDGYDDSHHGYLGFCMEKVVVINLAPLMARAARRPLPRKIVDELMYTVTHELAHLLEKDGGHGPAWRDTHERLVLAVYGKAVDRLECEVCEEE